MFDYTEHRCNCSDKTRAAAREMLQICKTHDLSVDEAMSAIEHLKANIMYLACKSPVSILHTRKETDTK